MLQPRQLQLLHIAARQVGLIEPGAGGDARWRLLLENVAGVTSAKDLDNVTFEDVMAVLEDFGFSNARQRHIDRGGFMGMSGSAGHAQSTYWRDKVAARGRQANARFVHKIRELAAKCPRYPLANLCMKFSNRRTEHPDKLTPREAWELIEMLKAAVVREASGAGG
jgi:membrane peptidoglycan carboxypeptidase